MKGPPPRTLAQVMEAIHARIDRSGGPDACWPCSGSHSAGYATVQARGLADQPLLVHRLVLEEKLGRRLLPGMEACHSCDFGRCCNPAHLFEGTHKDNMDDRDQKGRVASGARNGARTKPDQNPFIRNGGSGLVGEAHPMAVLTDAVVDEIRALRSQGAATLAEHFGVSETHIYRILAGKSRTKGRTP